MIKFKLSYKDFNLRLPQTTRCGRRLGILNAPRNSHLRFGHHMAHAQTVTLIRLKLLLLIWRLYFILILQRIPLVGMLLLSTFLRLSTNLNPLPLILPALKSNLSSTLCILKNRPATTSSLALSSKSYRLLAFNFLHNSTMRPCFKGTFRLKSSSC
jgi:hypothetical protein